MAVEQQYFNRGCRKVVGVDEVGRGCLAGPVVAAAVAVSPATIPITGVFDSKQLTSEKRRRLEIPIKQSVESWAIAQVSAHLIDQTSIVEATFLAMRRVIDKLTDIQWVLVDGLQIPGNGMRTKYRATAMVKGDQRVYAIAAASILAKVYRDRLMVRRHKRYPHYGWISNKGYGTVQHIRQLQQVGPSPLHRLSFITHLID